MNVALFGQYYKVLTDALKKADEKTRRFHQSFVVIEFKDAFLVVAESQLKGFKVININ